MSKLALLGGKPIRRKNFPTWPIITVNKIKSVKSVITSGHWDRGNLIEEFENKFAKYQDSQYCVATTSGTSSLFIALKVVGVGPGDEVLVPAYTYVATAAVVKLVGAEPVFVDIDPDTANIDLEDLSIKITRRTKAVIPVHFAGLPVNMNALRNITKKNLYVIEDAAQAHGAIFEGKKVGSLGDLGCFSFQQSKNLSSGEGGAITTNDIKLANKAFSFHNFGRPKNGPRYEFKMLGGNFRITDIQAALLLEGLKKIEKEATLRYQNANLLTELLKEFEFLSPIGSHTKKDSRRAYYLYVVRYKKEKFDNILRHVFIEALRAEGISVWYGYPKPLNSYEIFSKKNGKLFNWIKNSSCPEAQKLCEEAIWLPQNILLGSKNDIKDIAKAIEKIYDDRGELKKF